MPGGCWERLSKFDKFAPSIELELKNERHFTTPVGGLCTILFSVIAAVVLVIGVLDVFVDPKMDRTFRCLY